MATPVRFMALDKDPLHNVMFEGAITDGVGKTAIVNVVLLPIHVVPPLVNCEVTVTVELLMVVAVFVAVNGVIVPLPVEPIPTVALLLVQE